MDTLKKIYNFFFSYKTIDGKQWIEDSMTEKYGNDWLDKCLDGLRDSNVRKDLKDTLNL